MTTKKALEIVKQEISAFGDELHYFYQHIARFEYVCDRILSISKDRKIILDIGCHFLHQSMLLSLLGYSVFSTDMKYFAEQTKVKQRAKKYNINLFTVNDLERGFDTLFKNSCFEIVLFSEIMEHITFNPTFFWLEVNRITKPNSVIYISTPNSLRLLNIFSVYKNIFLLRCVGLDYKSVLSQVTYGHHWKEYSTWEIKQYFKSLFPEYKLTIKYYHYRKLSNEKSFKNIVRKFIIKLGRFLHIFSDELEILIYKSK